MKLTHWVCGVALTAVIGVSVGCAPGPVDGSSAAPARGALFGIYQQPIANSSVLQQKQRLQAAEATNGRRYDILHYYYQWGGGFPTWREPYWLSGNRTPLLSWAGPVTSSITNGSQDRIIDARARGLKALGRPVLLRWFWEMDGLRNRGRALNPTTYKAAWRRIVTRFRAAGAHNVEFVWCPTAWGFKNGTAPSWYPGDDVVDWTCTDGYNWAPLRPGSEWKSFTEIYQEYYDWAAKHPRPMLVGEFGVMEDSPGRKAQWLTDARNALKTRFPRIKGVVYFNGDGEEDRPYVWAINTSESSRAAWTAWAGDPYFRQRQ
ncbi:MAG: glycosyl hydrolase [Acidimicrobiales bacterium]